MNERKVHRFFPHIVFQNDQDGDGLDVGPDGGQGGEVDVQEVQGGQQEGGQGKVSCRKMSFNTTQLSLMSDLKEERQHC